MTVMPVLMLINMESMLVADTLKISPIVWGWSSEFYV